MTENGPTTTQTIASKIETAKARLIELDAERKNKAEAVDSLKGKVSDDNIGLVMVTQALTETVGKIEAVTADVQRFEKIEATAGMIGPLVKAFGIVDFTSVENVTGTVSIADITDRVSSDKAAALKAADRLTFSLALLSAVKDAKITPAQATDFASVKVKGESKTKGTLEVASRRASTGTRASSPAVTITSVPEGKGVDASLKGKTIRKLNGDSPDFDSWSDALKACVEPDVVTALTKKKDGTDRSISARGILDALGVKYEVRT